jgi:hypothetical protein
MRMLKYPVQVLKNQNWKDQEADTQILVLVQNGSTMSLSYKMTWTNLCSVSAAMALCAINLQFKKFVLNNKINRICRVTIMDSNMSHRGI